MWSRKSLRQVSAGLVENRQLRLVNRRDGLASLARLLSQIPGMTGEPEPEPEPGPFV